MRASRACAVWLVALSAAGCDKKPGDAPASASASAMPSVRGPSPPPAPATLAEALAAVDLRVEARRGSLSGYDPALEAHRGALEAHFGGAPPFPLAFQAVSLGPRGSVVLLQATRGESRPFVLALGARGEALWTKHNPLGGVKPGASEVSLASGPDGHACVAWCNAQTNSIALRRWAAFADYEAFHTDGCDALSTLYWPHHGWLLAVAYRGGSVLQLVSEDGVHVFGAEGMTNPWMSSAPAPISFGLDTEQSFLLVRLGQSGGPGSPEYVFANRYDGAGKPMWPGPLSVKRLTTLVEKSARVVLHPGREGGLRATLAAAEAGPDTADLEVLSDGTVRRR
jgi:hypothetical protein